MSCEQKMTLQEATDFFSKFYFGEHHIPSPIKAFGTGWVVKHDRGDLATYDFDQLTRLVLAAHEQAIRVSIMPLNFNTVKIAIWKREREGGMTKRHPTIEQAIESFKSKTSHS